MPLGLEIPSSCSALTRRQLLQVGGLSMLGLGLPGAVRAREPGSQSRGSEKSCIFIVLGGGPTHVDTWDLKPAAPTEIRGPYKPIATAVPGMHINELQPRLAKLSQHYTLIRSMTHDTPIRNHPDAMHNILCGQKKAPDDAPGMGSVMAKLRPTQRNLASYVWLQRCDGNTTVFCSPFISTGGFLGKPYAPLMIGSSANNPSMATYRVSELDTVGSASPERTRDRLELLRRLESSRNANGPHGGVGWDDLRKRAVELATGPDTRRAFALEHENPKLRDRYGRHPIGQYLLMARRLVESGVGFVSVNGWCGYSPGGEYPRGGAPFSWGT